jgi:hypothetical protein
VSHASPSPPYLTTITTTTPDIVLYIRNSVQFYLRNWAPKQHEAKVEEIKKQVFTYLFIYSLILRLINIIYLFIYLFFNPPNARYLHNTAMLPNAGSNGWGKQPPHA